MSLIIKCSQNIFKNNSKRKRNSIIYHFVVERNPHERIDLLIRANVNIYQAKKTYSNSNENFSERKMIKQFGNPLSTNPLSPSNFFMTPFCPNFKKQETPPNCRGEETMWYRNVSHVTTTLLLPGIEIFSEVSRKSL